MNRTPFMEGYKEAEKKFGALFGAERGDTYVHEVEKVINDFNNDINKYSGVQTDIRQLKGIIAEAWHTGTFNIDATVKNTGERVYMPGSNILGSADIRASWEIDYGSKYYDTPGASAKAQAISYFERFRQSKFKGTFEEYCQINRLGNPDEIMHRPLYEGQVRIIPTDQLPEAKEDLERIILEEQQKRPELVEKYRETLEEITDRINSPKGASSVPLNEKTSRVIAGEAKGGEFDAGQYGFNTGALISFDQIVKDSLTAGMNAAILVTILKLAPEFVKIMGNIIRSEGISEKDFIRLGIESISTVNQSFLRGFTTYFLITSLRAGKMGEVVKTIDPVIIGIATALAFNTLGNALKMAKGEINKNEFTEAFMRDLYIALLAYGGVVAFQFIIPIPYIGAILGNIVGSIVGAFTYTAVSNLYLSFCVESGYTLLGIVEQDYTLPDEVLKEMGLDIVITDCCVPEICRNDTCDPDVCEPDICNPDIVGIFTIRRGVIGINKIGYVFG